MIRLPATPAATSSKILMKKERNIAKHSSRKKMRGLWLFHCPKEKMQEISRRPHASFNF
jgi:hypothetical protein